MATRTLTVAGHEFTIQAPYVAGPHELTEGEAAALNQTRAENISNQLRKALALIAEDGNRSDEQKLADMTKLVAERDAEYTFGVRAAGAPRVVDPVQKEARAIAREAITAKLKEQGRKVKDIDAEALEAKIAEIAATDKVQRLAQKRVKERQAALADIGEVDVPAPAEPVAAE